MNLLANLKALCDPTTNQFLKVSLEYRYHINDLKKNENAICGYAEKIALNTILFREDYDLDTLTQHTTDVAYFLIKMLKTAFPKVDQDDQHEFKIRIDTITKEYNLENAGEQR